MTDLVIDKNTWIISDTHFGHDNIVKYCNRPEDHETIIYDNWQRLVKPEDVVLHLGDLAVWYGQLEKYWLGVARDLPGIKYMLRGNHDLLEDSEYAKLGYTMISEFVQKIGGKRVFFSHYPAWDPAASMQDSDGWDVNIHGHVHTREPFMYRRGNINQQSFNVSVELMEYKPCRLGDVLTNRRI